MKNFSLDIVLNLVFIEFVGNYCINCYFVNNVYIWNLRTAGLEIKMKIV
ncbi:hypothetical protein [Acetomicrobium sp.]